MDQYGPVVHLGIGQLSSLLPVLHHSAHTARVLRKHGPAPPKTGHGSTGGVVWKLSVAGGELLNQSQKKPYFNHAHIIKYLETSIKQC